MLAVRAADVFDGTRFLGSATVLVEGGTIVGVETRSVALPEDCTEFRHDGLLLPGLIDTHTHLVADSQPGALDRIAGYDDQQLADVVAAALTRELRAGVTSVRDLGDRGFNVADRSVGPREPTVVAAGPPITTPGGHCHYLGGVLDTVDIGPAAVEAAIADRVEHGVDVVKIMASGGMLTPGTDVLAPQFTDDAMRLIVDAAHTAGLPVTAHAHAVTAVRQAVLAGVDGIEHCSCLGPTGVELHPALFEEIAAAGIVVCATAGQDQDIPFVPPPSIQAVLDQMGVTEETLFADRLRQLAALHAAGVSLVCGADSGIGDNKAHGIVALSVADHLAAGIPVDVVLAGATSLAATVCGLPGKGRLAAGADADLLLLDADPRTDQLALRSVAGVWLAGERMV